MPSSSLSTSSDGRIPPAAEADVDFVTITARLEAVPFQNKFQLTHTTATFQKLAARRVAHSSPVLA
ncbi:MAG: hypothetical protein LAO23_12460 [Acidobacteriia bacterium]|nr:hypothetical protein [Terriglobia bacterium]